MSKASRLLYSMPLTKKKKRVKIKCLGADFQVQYHHQRWMLLLIWAVHFWMSPLMVPQDWNCNNLFFLLNLTPFYISMIYSVFLFFCYCFRLLLPGLLLKIPIICSIGVIYLLISLHSCTFLIFLYLLYFQCVCHVPFEVLE